MILTITVPDCLTICNVFTNSSSLVNRRELFFQRFKQESATLESQISWQSSCARSVLPKASESSSPSCGISVGIAAPALAVLRRTAPTLQLQRSTF